MPTQLTAVLATRYEEGDPESDQAHDPERETRERIGVGALRSC
jgi:hypothetical protein